jgi:hypothetical protein
VADPEQVEPPFYERRWFQGAVAVVGLLTAVWAFSGAPKPWQVASEISATQVTLSNTEIILDASEATAARFGSSGNKLKAEARAVGQYAAPLKYEGIALRRAGGSCGEEPELLVGFGTDHGETVAEAALEQEPGGRANVVQAVRAAIDEFQQAKYKEPNTTERILIFMSGEDECRGDAGMQIRDALERSGVNAVFRLVALRPSRAQLGRLKRFRRQLTSFARVEIRTPTSKRQLNHVVKREVRAAKADAAANSLAASGAGSAGGEAAGGSSGGGGEGGGAEPGKAAGSSASGQGGSQSLSQGQTGTAEARPQLRTTAGEEEEGEGKKKKEEPEEAECPEAASAKPKVTEAETDAGTEAGGEESTPGKREEVESKCGEEAAAKQEGKQPEGEAKEAEAGEGGG